jgi:hypothetical protein
MSQIRVEKYILLPTEPAGISDALEGKNADADKLLKGSLPLINCECGAQILLVPDLPVMNRAINAHVANHKKNERNAMRNAKTSCNFNQMLSQSSLRKVSELTDI